MIKLTEELKTVKDCLDISDLPEEQVLVKVSFCKKCNSIIKSGILHLMSAKDIRSFDREVKKYDLSVKIVPLLEYRTLDMSWCKCE